MCCTRGKSIPGISQSVHMRCRSDKSPSFGLCQVDMYVSVDHFLKYWQLSNEGEFAHLHDQLFTTGSCQLRQSADN